MKRSRHYRIGLQDKCFGTKVFWQWFSLGAFKAFILMYICLFAQEIALRPDGGNTSLYPSGAVIYAGVVIIANHKLLIAYNTHHLLGFLISIVSITLYFVVFAFESLTFVQFDNVLGTFVPTFTHPMTYFGLLFVVWVNYMLDRIFDFVGQMLDEREENRKKNIVELPESASAFNPLLLSSDRNSSRSSIHRHNLEEKPHTGFAFAEENNPNPELFERVRTSTRQRMRKDKTEQ